MVKTYKVGGMNCNHCKNTVEKAISKIEGVDKVVVLLEENEAQIEFNSVIPVSQLQETLSEAGLFFILEKEESKGHQDTLESTATKEKKRFLPKFLKNVFPL